MEVLVLIGILSGFGFIGYGAVTTTCTTHMVYTVDKCTEAYACNVTYTDGGHGTFTAPQPGDKYEVCE